MVRKSLCASGRRRSTRGGRCHPVVPVWRRSVTSVRQSLREDRSPRPCSFGMTHRLSAIPVSGPDAGSRLLSIVVAGLEKIDPSGADRIDQSMFFGDAAGPRAGQHVFQRFRFPDALKWISHCGFDQVQDSQGDPAIGLDPVAQVLAKFGMKDREPLRPACQVRTRAEAFRPIAV